MDARTTGIARRAAGALALTGAVVALAAVSLPLAVFALAGALAGAGASRLAGHVAIPRPRVRWVVGAALLLAGAAAAVFLPSTERDGAPQHDPVPREIVTARYAAEARYVDDRFVLAEQLAVPPRQIAAIAAQLGGGGDPARLVASRLEQAGLELVESVDGALVARFPARSLAIETPWWTRRATLDLDVPTVDLGPVVVRADEASAVTLVAPARLVAGTSPTAVRIDPLPGGREATRIPVGSEFAALRVVGLELRGPLARAPVVGALVDSSPWNALWWIAGLLAGYFRKKLGAFVEAALDGLFRRVRRPGSAPA